CAGVISRRVGAKRRGAGDERSREEPGGDVDSVDRLLLDALRANARATYAELARVVGLSAPAAHERVAKLEAAGVITGYHAAVAPEALGYAMNALIGIFLTDNADTDELTASLTAI